MLKVFQTGFTDQQHRVHFKHILNDDLRKLGSLQTHAPLTIELLFDEVDYLGGTYYGQGRESVLAETRDKIALGADILIARKTRGKDWQVTAK